MSGQKKRQSPMPSKAEVEKWKVRLADLQRRQQSFIDAGMTDTAWDKQIEELEVKIAGVKVEVIKDGK